MKSIKTQQLANGALWASAILASAALGGPQLLTLILLPALGFVAVANMRTTKC